MGKLKPYYQDEYVTIYHADCREGIRELPDNSVDLVLTDPPYGICEQDGKVQMRGNTIVDPRSDYGDWDAFDPSWLSLIRAKSLICFHDHKQATVLWRYLQGINWHPRQFVFWDKGDGGLNPRKNFVNTIEMAVFATKNSKYTWNGGGSTINLIRRNRAPTPLHPTQKPELIFSKLISLLTNKGDLVLDPFLGSGTTAFCAKKLGRRCIGIEISEEYCEIAARRCSQGVFDLVTDNGRRCYVCGSHISGKRADSNYCSNRCRQVAYRQRMLRVSVTDKAVTG